MIFSPCTPGANPVLSDEQRFERLNGWLDVLQKEVRQLRVDQHIFWEVQKIIQANPRINKLGSSFYHWMGSAYATSMTVAIRRQVDGDSRSISFRNLLRMLRMHPEVLSRTRYKHHFVDANSPLPEAYRDRDYDRLVGEGRDILNPTDLEKEIADLQMVTDGLRQYVNKRIAHYDEEHFKRVPRFNDIDAAVEFLDRLLKRYLLLFRAVHIDTALPTWQYDWTEIFRHPWILGE